MSSHKNPPEKQMPFWQLTEDDVQLVAYRFHWQDEKTELIKRWENAKHHPEIKTFPFHMHAGEEKEIKESGAMELFHVLKILEAGEVRTDVV